MEKRLLIAAALAAVLPGAILLLRKTCERSGQATCFAIRTSSNFRPSWR